MEFQKHTQNFSFGFSLEKLAGTGSGVKKYTDIKINTDTLLTGINSAYKGIGCVSGNNSSRLLLDYKALHPEIYHELLRLLFEKGYGAELSHIKLEFGADINSSSGTEPSTMRSFDEKPDITRGAGFIFASDALKINPDLTIDLLRWGEPGWVKKAFEISRVKGFEARYKWYADTISEAYNRLGIKFTHISPDANETANVDSDWIIYFAQRLRSDSSMPYDCSAIKIVASDEVGTRTIAEKMIANERLRNSVDIIGLHYTTYGDENTERLYSEFGKEIWYSEGIAPSNISSLSIKKDLSGLAGRNGAVDVANRIINGWYHGKMTMYEFQPAISAYYDGSCYYPKHIIRANEPWSGHYELESGFYMTMHFTRFIGKDWHPVRSACFGNGEENHYIENTTANYITLMPEDCSEFTTIITNDSNRSRHYRIILENCDFSDKRINVIETASPELGKPYDSGWFRLTRSEMFKNDAFTVSIKPNSIVTVTTINADFVSGTGTTDNISPNRKRLILPYRDSFSYSSFTEDFLESRGGAPLFSTDQGGAFEIVSVDGKKWLEQKITDDIIPENWRYRGTPAPITCLGDDSWANYTARVKTKLCGADENNYVGLGVRYNSAVACEVTSNCGFAVTLYYDGKWELLYMDGIVESGKIEPFDPDGEHILSIMAVGNLYIAYIDGKVLGSYDEKGAIQTNGRISLLSGYYKNRFTELEIKPVPAMNTYVNAADAMDSSILYFGNIEMKAMETYKYSNRTIALLHEGSGFSVQYAGNGFALCGTVKDAVITIELDGKILTEHKNVGGSTYRQAFYRCDSCKFGEHSLVLSIEKGEVILDSVLSYTNSPEYGIFEPPKTKNQSALQRSAILSKAAVTTAAGAAAVLLLKRSIKRKK